MSRTKNEKKNEKAILAKNLSEGIDKFLSSKPSLDFGDESLTPAEVKAQLMAIVRLREEANTAKAAWDQRLAREKAQLPALWAFLSSFVTFVRATYGRSPDKLAQFGLAPPKERRALTADELTTKVAKAKSTRKARGTMGKKKKLAIKGDVVGVVTAPITVTLNTPVKR